MSDQPCPSCGGLNGAHGSVHVRFGNGGGGNLPCPRAHRPLCDGCRQRPCACVTISLPPSGNSSSPGSSSDGGAS